MIIDMHATVVPSEDDPAVTVLGGLPHTRHDPRKCTEMSTLERMDRAGVQQSVVWCLGATMDECRRYNEFIADIARDHPDRFIPFATIPPTNDEDALDELHRVISVLGMAGLKLHPDVFLTSIADPGFLALVAALRDLDRPLVTHVAPTLARDLPSGTSWREVEDPISDTPHSEYSAPRHLEALVAVWDSPRVQLAHMGGVLLETILGSSVTLQTAGASLEVIKWSIERFGIERIVFGSDYPFFSVEDEVAKVNRLGLSDHDRLAILGGNAITKVLKVAKPNSQSRGGNR